MSAAGYWSYSCTLSLWRSSGIHKRYTKNGNVQTHKGDDTHGVFQERMHVFHVVLILRVIQCAIVHYGNHSVLNRAQR